jgi:hypothetical protein
MPSHLGEGGMQEVFNQLATVALAATTVTLLALFLGWARGRE